MTDEEMATYLGFNPDNPEHAKAVEVVRALTPAKRALYERMAEVEIEFDLWEAGLP